VNKHTVAVAIQHKTPMLVNKPYKGLILPAMSARSPSKRLGVTPKEYPVVIPTIKNSKLGMNVINSLMSIFIPKERNLEVA
jgi:hypothetical protein